MTRHDEPAEGDVAGVAEVLAAAWDEGFEAAIEWVERCGRPADIGPPDPPLNAYETPYVWIRGDRADHDARPRRAGRPPVSADLTTEQVERLHRVLPVLARGQKRHPDTSAAMAALGPLLGLCARCGEVPVIGDPDDLPCCGHCGSAIGYQCASDDAVHIIEHEVAYLRSIGTRHADGKARALERVARLIAEHAEREPA